MGWAVMAHHYSRQTGARMLKIAIFDEVNESTAVFNLAEKREGTPEQGFWFPSVPMAKTCPPTNISAAHQNHQPLPRRAGGLAFPFTEELQFLDAI